MVKSKLQRSYQTTWFGGDALQKTLDRTSRDWLTVHHSRTKAALKSHQAHDVLQGIYETNQHPGGDETWRDPRGREGASLGDTAELDLLESKIPADLLNMAKAAFWKKAAPLFARLVWSRMLQDHATCTQPNTHFFFKPFFAKFTYAAFCRTKKGEITGCCAFYPSQK